MKLFLVRHGESTANIARILNDDPTRSVDLTERGKAQAEAAALRLCDVAFTHAYASEFPRAQQTAGIILRGRGLELHVDARLNERHSGMDGLHVDVFNDFVRPDPLHIKPPRGESFLEQMERLRSFMDEIARCHPDGIVLAVSHENPILAAQALSVADPGQVVHLNIANCETVELVWPL